MQRLQIDGTSAEALPIRLPRLRVRPYICARPRDCTTRNLQTVPHGRKSITLSLYPAFRRQDLSLTPSECIVKVDKQEMHLGEAVLWRVVGLCVGVYFAAVVIMLALDARAGG